jgi:hypothetical protein
MERQCLRGGINSGYTKHSTSLTIALIELIMNSFLQLYQSQATAQCRSIPTESFRLSAQDVHVAGTMDTVGWFGQFNQNGSPVWQNLYLIDKSPIAFHRSLQCDNGDFILYGSYSENPETPPEETRYHNLVMRVDARGQLIWAKTYNHEYTRRNADIIKSPDDTYIFTSRLELDSRHQVELVKIDGNGDVMRSIRASMTDNDYVIGLIPWTDGCIVYGNSDLDDTTVCFIAGFDGSLKLQFWRMLGEKGYQTLTGVLQLTQEKFVITGEIERAHYSYLAEFNLGATVLNGHVYDFKKEEEGGFKLLRKGPPGGFYLVADMPGMPRLNFVARFDAKYHMKWMRRFKLREDHILYDLQYDNEGEKGGLLICGATPAAGNNQSALLACTDDNMNSCATADLPVPQPGNIQFPVRDWDVVIKDHEVMVTNHEPRIKTLLPEAHNLCKGGPAPDLRNKLVQSPYIYLQTAGSTQADDSVPGYHLRWEFMRTLGEQHLPKGNLSAPGGPYSSNIAFNKPDDFVRIYKTEFSPEYGIVIDFVKPPTTVVEAGFTRDWIYFGLVSSTGLKTDVMLRFTDRVMYNFIRQSINPSTNPQEFLASYTAPIELRTSGKLFFYLEIGLAGTTGTGTGRMRLETISLPDRLDPSTRQISSRRIVPEGLTKDLVGDNWEYLRFDLRDAVPTRMYLIPFEDYITGINSRNGWVFWNQYSLDDGNSDGNAQVFRWLEDTSNFTVDREWRKFNEPTTTEFRVNAENYRKRWIMTNGLKEAVITYLDKSRIDPLANVTLPNQDPQANDAETEISYLLMLKFAGLDFHAGRMLGFGAIDPMPNSPEQGRRVYMMQYHTSASLENSPAQLVSHLYMAPPIAPHHHRLPLSPELLPIVYGLSPDACGGTTSLTDADGYAHFADVRFINLHRKPFRYERPFEAFFASAAFDLFLNTQTVLFGVEYAPGLAGTGNWARPELSHDTDWLDHGGLPEVRPVPDSGENPVYTHGETTPGIHHYAMYSINWFSRVSELSNEVQTDTTVFNPRNTLLPPANFMVQLVQKEDPTILTSVSEQGLLASMGSGDKTLVRATFNWNQVHNKAFQYADKAQLFFRVSPPLVVRGKISTVSVNTVTHTALLTTTSYLQSSQPATVQPFVAAADMSRFVGASIVVDGETFVVSAIVTSGNNPQIRVKQIRQTSSMDSLNENEFCTTETFISPTADKTFLMVENLDQPSSWDTQLTKEVTLTQFLPVHTEIENHADGQSTTHYIGGLTGAVTINHVFDTDPTLGPFIPAGGPPANQVPTGVYTISYSTAVMLPHPETDVSYYQGTIRLRALSGEIRELQVWNIDLATTHPVLTVFDPTFSLQRDASGMFILSGGQFTNDPATDPILTGVQSFANFHPGYRVYLRADLSGGRNFGEAAMLPALDEGTKQTFMAIRSRDVNLSLNSYMSTPAILLAREIREPVPPGIPLGNVYATRPNFYGKSTFTFDVQVNQPYSIIFYKANERKILDQLYHPAKVTEILTALAQLSPEDAAFSQNRWSDLVNMITDAGGQFKEYVPGGFRFPPPTNSTYSVPDPALPAIVNPFSPANNVPPGSTAIVPGTGRSWQAIVREAITGAFVPLTELPPVYSQIRNTTIQTSGRPPKLRDVNGNRLPPSSPDYDPWPMVVRFERNAADLVLVSGNAGYGNADNRRFVRFTDYNLDGAATNMYFYFSKELSNTLAVSGASPVVGPVKLVNAAPAEAPGIGRVITLVKNSQQGTRDGVRFELNEYLPAEGIKSIQLYRATDPDDALSIRTMTLVKTVDAGTDLEDTFDDVSFIPYNEPVFYRIIALRQIQNERGEIELIPSKPSNLVMASLIDNSNPPAPRLAFSSDPPIGSPIQLHNVVLSWSPTCYNGQYILYKKGSGGHWMKIAQVSGNDPVFYQSLAASDLASGTLPKQDEDLNYLFHHFKVVAINSSGLMAKEESTLRI